MQLVTAIRVYAKWPGKTHLKPAPHKEKQHQACKLEKPLPKANSRRALPGTLKFRQISLLPVSKALL
jgi:hypothetical protein